MHIHTMHIHTTWQRTHAYYMATHSAYYMATHTCILHGNTFMHITWQHIHTSWQPTHTYYMTTHTYLMATHTHILHVNTYILHGRTIIAILHTYHGDRGLLCLWWRTMTAKLVLTKKCSGKLVIQMCWYPRLLR